MNPHIILHDNVAMVLRTSIISESEVPNMVLCLLCSPVTQQYESRAVQKYACNQGNHYENTMVPRALVIARN